MADEPGIVCADKVVSNIEHVDAMTHNAIQAAENPETVLPTIFGKGIVISSISSCLIEFLLAALRFKNHPVLNITISARCYAMDRRGASNPASVGRQAAEAEQKPVIVVQRNRSYDSPLLIPTLGLPSAGLPSNRHVLNERKSLKYAKHHFVGSNF